MDVDIFFQNFPVNQMGAVCLLTEMAWGVIAVDRVNLPLLLSAAAVFQR